MVLARCNQCKEVFPSKGAANRHANAAGHTALAAYICTVCDETFRKLKLFKQHVTETKHIQTSAAVASFASSGASPGLVPPSIPEPSAPVSCPECNLQFSSSAVLKTHRATSHHKVVPAVKRCPGCGKELPIGEVHLQCITTPVSCPICNVEFKNGAELVEHATGVLSCDKCQICFRPSETLSDHWWESIMHPKCHPCALGFEDLAAWTKHLDICPAVHLKKPSKKIRIPQLSGESTEQVPTSSNTSSVSNKPVTVNEGDDMSFASTAAGQSEDARPRRQDNRPTIETDGSLAIPVHARETAGARWSTRGSSQVDASSEVNLLSWHCRSCLRDPCVDPVTTLCGHVFCHGCFVQEVESRLCCAVCSTPFLVRLDVGA